MTENVLILKHTCQMPRRVFAHWLLESRGQPSCEKAARPALVKEFCAKPLPRPEFIRLSGASHNSSKTNSTVGALGPFGFGITSNLDKSISFTQRGVELLSFDSEPSFPWKRDAFRHAGLLGFIEVFREKGAESSEFQSLFSKSDLSFENSRAFRKMIAENSEFLGLSVEGMAALEQSAPYESTHRARPQSQIAVEPLAVQTQKAQVTICSPCGLFEFSLPSNHRDAKTVLFEIHEHLLVVREMERNSENFQSIDSRSLLGASHFKTIQHGSKIDFEKAYDFLAYVVAKLQITK